MKSVDPASVEHWVVQQTGSAGRNGEKPLLIASTYKFPLSVGTHVYGQHHALQVNRTLVQHWVTSEIGSAGRRVGWLWLSSVL